MILRLERSTDLKRSREPHQNGVIFREQALDNLELCSHLPPPNFRGVPIVGEPLAVTEMIWRVQCMARVQFPCFEATKAQKSREGGKASPRLPVGQSGLRLLKRLDSLKRLGIEFFSVVFILGQEDGAAGSM